MRGKRAFIFITIYLAILAGLFWAALQAGREFWTIGALESISFGRGIFGAVMFIETLVIVALAPAYTAGLISQEREKQTFDLLSVTPISSLSIILGKLLSGLSYLGLVVGASIPIASVAFLFGGIDVIDLVRGYALLIVTGFGVGAIGVWCSAAMKRTQPATVSAFVITALLVLGATGSWIILNSRVADDGTRLPAPPEALLYLNPFAAMADVVCQATGATCFVGDSLAPPAPDPFAAPVAVPAQPAGVVQGGVAFGPDGQPLGGGGAFVQGGGMGFQQPVSVPGGGFWPKTVITYLLLTPLVILGAAQSLSPTRRWRWPGRSRPRVLAVKPTDD
jgi:ABC-type transport system involved in multi-copper enzyme maturation permease subunit